MRMNFLLNNNCSMPAIALGTYKKNISEVYNNVLNAIDIGYRHFDTGFLYLNEKEVGKAIKFKIEQKNLNRKNFFITTKLPMNGMEPDKVEYFFYKSLKNLQLDYIDLYLIHAPFAVKYVNDNNFYPTNKFGDLEINKIDLISTWKEFETLYCKGMVRSIGVSNFNINQLEKLLKNSTIKPMVNQIECHLYFQNKKIINYCKKNNIQVSAFAPLGSPLKFKNKANSFLNNEKIIELSLKYNKSPAQIVLRFLTQKNIAVLPSADNKIQLLENYNSTSFDLEICDLNKMHLLNKNERLFFFNHVQSIIKHPEYPFEINYSIQK